MKAKDAGRVNEGNRDATARTVHKSNKDSLTGSPGRVVVGGVPAFDLENYHTIVNKDVVICNDHITNEALAAIDTLASLLGKVRKVIIDYVEAMDITTRSTKAKPRLKWEKDRREGETPAQFAWRAYAVEAAAGTLHRGLIYRENPELHRRLTSWLRSHPMPEGIDIPTKPEWNTRLLAKFDRPLRPRASAEEGRLYNVAGSRRRKRRARPSNV